MFMSPEDVAAGRKTNWTAIEITGAFSCVASSASTAALLQRPHSFADRIDSLISHTSQAMCAT